MRNAMLIVFVFATIASQGCQCLSNRCGCPCSGCGVRSGCGSDTAAPIPMPQTGPEDPSPKIPRKIALQSGPAQSTVMTSMRTVEATDNPIAPGVKVLGKTLTGETILLIPGPHLESSSGLDN